METAAMTTAMTTATTTVGQLVTAARRRASLSQKELASRLVKEDGTSISPPYMNDIERDRRNPPPPHLLRQLAAVLGLSEEHLLFLAGDYPPDLRAEAGTYPPAAVEAAFDAFRETARGMREGTAEPVTPHDGPGLPETVLLYQPIVREEARRLAKGLHAFPEQARSLPRRKIAALEAAAEVLEMIAGPERPQRRPGNLEVRRLRPRVKEGRSVNST